MFWFAVGWLWPTSSLLDLPVHSHQERQRPGALTEQQRVLPRASPATDGVNRSSKPGFRLADCRQVVFSGDPHNLLGLPPDIAVAKAMIPRKREIPGRRVPRVAEREDWCASGLTNLAVSLPEANTLAHLNYLKGHFGCLQRVGGERMFFNPEMVLVKFSSASLISVVRVELGRELEAARAIAGRGDVEFAELDILQQRCFLPNDPLIGNQWHHATIQSFEAWNYGAGQSSVRVAIVDTPFQMDHPDLIANTVAGWDAVANQPVTFSPGIDHSTLGAGLVAAAANNGLGVAGVANCLVLPINSNGFESELCNAVYWAASNGVRVVNISWTGAGSDALNAAGNYLKVQAHGLLVMAGENGTGQLAYPNQPDIWAISMTDAADNQHSKYGAAIDFAAPGWAVYSTLSGGGYGSGSGTSYAAPIFAGVVARLFTINPVLEPDDVIDILKTTARDLGDPGWDMWFGWGRINFGAAAVQAQARLPRISIVGCTSNQVMIATGLKTRFSCQLWRSAVTNSFCWTLVSNMQVSTNGNQLVLTDPSSLTGGALYRVSVSE